MRLPTYEQTVPELKALAVQRVVTSVSFIAMILVTIAYSFGATRPAIQDVSNRHFTTCTPNSVMTFDVFVGLTFITQAQYLVKLLATTNEALLITVTKGVSYHFCLFCGFYVCIVLAWTMQRFMLVEFLLLASLINLGLLYLRLGPAPHRTTMMKNVNVQIPLSKLPMALNIMYVLPGLC